MKHGKIYLRISIIMCLFLIILVSVYLAKDSKNKAQTDHTIVIYTSRSDNLLDATIPLFEEKYGIQVEIVNDELGELLN